MFAAALVALLLAVPHPASASASASAADATLEARNLYAEMHLDGVLAEHVFVTAYESVRSHGLDARVLAVADMSQPSTAKRFYVFDLQTKTLVRRTWVAHGSGSGGLMAEHFSNRDGSHQTSLGLYRVGAPIVSPKHGRSLALDGLDRGVNDNARAREVIIHGASYVSAGFIAQQGRLGRSWGCPALPEAEMPAMINLLSGKGLLYVYGA